MVSKADQSANIGHAVPDDHVQISYISADLLAKHGSLVLLRVAGAFKAVADQPAVDGQYLLKECSIVCGSAPKEE